MNPSSHLDQILPFGSSKDCDPYLQPPPLRTQAEIISTWNPSDKVLVTICCATYQHERFIADALRGFLGQVTTFPFKILVRDDASSDRTAAIIMEFAQHYPLIIIPIIEQINQYRLGIRAATVFEPLIEGACIAQCEGDDYWINPQKLQAQVDLLMDNPSAQVVVTKSFEINDGERVPHSIIPSFSPRDYNSDAIMLYGQWPKTLARLSRLSWYKFYWEKVPPSIRVDNTYVTFTVMMAQDDACPILLLDSCMGVYRKHAGGIFTGSTPLQKAQRTIYKAAFLKAMFCNSRWRQHLQNQLSRHASVIILSANTVWSDKASAFKSLASHSSPRETISFFLDLAAIGMVVLNSKFKRSIKTIINSFHSS